MKSSGEQGLVPGYTLQISLRQIIDPAQVVALRINGTSCPVKDAP